MRLIFALKNQNYDNYLLNIYLFLAEGHKFTKNYNKIGLSGVIGGVSLGIANISFILSITTTTAAVTMMMLATQPFVAAILAYVFLREKISRQYKLTIYKNFHLKEYSIKLIKI